MSHVRGTLIKMFQGSIVRRIHMTATAAQCDVKSEKGAIFEEVALILGQSNFCIFLVEPA